MTRMFWTDERIATLTEMWAKGIPVHEIGDALGVTRNAVIGKANRLGLKTHVDAVMVGKARVREAKPKPEPKFRVKTAPVMSFEAEEPPPIVDSVVMPKSLEMSLLDLGRNDCRWPSGLRAPFTFCGHDVAEGKPYCAYHCRLSYEPSSRMREVA